jgi:hypothetical protein
MSNCNLPAFAFSFTLPGLPAFPSFTLPVFTLPFNLSCPLD